MPGTYYLRVQGYNGATNPLYLLDINLTDPANGGSHDSPATAYDLGQVGSSTTKGPLSIDTPGGADWFKFTTLANGLPGTYVSLQYQLADGDLDMELYDSTGSKLLDSSTGAHDNELISLDGRPAGTYYVKVFGASGAVNPDYTVAIRSLGPDYFDSVPPANNSFSTATSLGRVEGHEGFQNLSIDRAADLDFFKFSTDGFGAAGNSIVVTTPNSSGALNLILWTIPNPQIPIPMPEGFSTSSGSRAQLDMSGLAPGTYYLQVSGSLTPAYNLDFYLPYGPAGDRDEPNDSFAAATDLRTLLTQEVRDGLSITLGDLDLFTFQTTADGVDGDTAFIDFDHNDGALLLQLYDSSETLLATAADPSTDRETISLAGRPKGTYFLLVAGNGGTNPVYRLTINPPNTANKDWAENNNDSAHAYDLKTVQGLQTYDPLSINEPGDVDWFSFRTVSSGTSSDSVQITYNAAQGGLTLALYDSSAKLIKMVSGPTNTQSISLDGLAAGTYLIEIAGADGSVVNPSYRLTIQAPPVVTADRFEHNDSYQTATILGTLSGSDNLTDLSIDTPTDQDWFTFKTAAAGTGADSIQVVFDAARGTPSLELYDANHKLVNSISTPTFLDASGLQAAIEQFSSTRGLLALGLDPTKPYSQLQIQQAFLQYAIRFGLTWASEQFTLAGLPAGTYFVRVISAYPEQTVPSYSLTINAPVPTAVDWAEAHVDSQNNSLPNDDSMANAYPLGSVEGQTQWTGLSIDHPTDVDWYSFYLPYAGLGGDFAAIDFTLERGEIDLSLYDASDNLLASSTGVFSEQKVSLQGLKAGTYYLEVAGYSGATNPAYTLTVHAPGDASSSGDAYEPYNSFDNPYPLGPLQGESTYGDNGLPLSIYDASDEDWFSFKLLVTGQSSNFVRIESDSTKGDIDLELYDQADNRIGISAGLRDVEQISLNKLAPGTYYVRVFGYNGSSSPSYTLSINAPGDDLPNPNHNRQAAYDLGQVQGTVTKDNLWLTSPLDDWFHFTMAAGSQTSDSVSVSTDQATAIDVAVYASGSTPVRDSGWQVKEASVALAGLAPGDYYVQVKAQEGGNTYYSLSITAPYGLAPDWSEKHDGLTDDDTLAHAYALNTVQGLTQWNDPKNPLSIDHTGDEDWFRFQLSSSGLSGQYARIDYLLAQGDIDLDLTDASGKLLARSATASDEETVSLAGLPAGTYYVRVYGYKGATNPEYSLTINAPVPATGDWAEPDDSWSDAHDLRMLTAPVELGPFSIDHAGDVDRFKFQTALQAINGQYVAISFSQALGDLDLRLYDVNHTLLRLSTGTGDSELISLEGLPAGIYFVEIVEADMLENPRYSLIIAPPGPVAGDWADQVQSNNSQAQATDLRQVDGLQEWTGLTIQTATDVDWYRFELLTTAVVGNYVGLEQDFTLGDLDLTLYDASNVELARAPGPSNFEQISLAGMKAGTYYLKVSGRQNATSPNYSIWIDAPHAPGSGILSDWAEPNDTFDAARSLDQVQGSHTWGQLSIDTTGNDDWFKFQTIGTGASRPVCANRLHRRRRRNRARALPVKRRVRHRGHF